MSPTTRDARIPPLVDAVYKPRQARLRALLGHCPKGNHHFARVSYGFTVPKNIAKIFEIVSALEYVEGAALIETGSALQNRSARRGCWKTRHFERIECDVS